MSPEREVTAQIPAPCGLLGVLADVEQDWKYGPELYWYVTRPLWWARWRIWSWRYWRAVQLLGRSRAAQEEGARS